MPTGKTINRDPEMWIKTLDKMLRDSVLLVGDSLCIDGRHIPLSDWHQRWIRTEPQPIIDKPDS